MLLRRSWSWWAVRRSCTISPPEASFLVVSKLAAQIRTILTQGVTPQELALALTLGLALGITPVLGSTTLLCAAAAASLRLNLPAMQVVNWITYPLQLVLLIPFLRLGAWLFGVEFALPLEHVVHLVTTQPWRAIVELWTATIHGLVAWAALSAVLAVPIYRVILALLGRVSKRP